jgi:hypothetical protein
MTTTYIYTLSDPRDGNIRYVGRTTRHRSGLRRFLNHCSTWLAWTATEPES